MLEWIILACLNCDVDRARAEGWRSEAALAETGVYSWSQSDPRRFQSRRQCMRELRRAAPETDWSAPDAYGQIDKITHYPDYVEHFQSIPGAMNGAIYSGCFSVTPPTS